MRVTTPNVKDHEAFSVGVSAGTWFHWAMTFVPGSGGLRFYVNGTPVNTQLAYGFKDAAGATEMWLGQNEWGGQEFRGLFDEVRLRAGVRSADWLAAEYHAMADDDALALLRRARRVREVDLETRVDGHVEDAVDEEYKNEEHDVHQRRHLQSRTSPSLFHFFQKIN